MICRFAHCCTEGTNTSDGWGQFVPGKVRWAEGVDIVATLFIRALVGQWRVTISSPSHVGFLSFVQGASIVLRERRRFRSPTSCHISSLVQGRTTARISELRDPCDHRTRGTLQEREQDCDSRKAQHRRYRTLFDNDRSNYHYNCPLSSPASSKQTLHPPSSLQLHSIS